MPAIGFHASKRSSSSQNHRKDFFDRESVILMMDKKTYHAFNRFGFLTMKDSRENIRRRNKSSKPGQSPTYWGESDGASRKIDYVTDQQRRSVIIGPVVFSKSKSENVPRALEEGGVTRNKETGRTQTIAPRPYLKPAFDRQLKRQAAKLIAAGVSIR